MDCIDKPTPELKIYTTTYESSGSLRNKATGKMRAKVSLTITMNVEAYTEETAQMAANAVAQDLGINLKPNYKPVKFVCSMKSTQLNARQRKARSVDIRSARQHCDTKAILNRIYFTCKLV